MLLPDSREDALQKVCGLHSNMNPEGVWHFYSRECISIKGQSLKIYDIKLNNSLEWFHSEPASQNNNNNKKKMTFHQHSGLNLYLSDWKLISLNKRQNMASK